MRFVVTALIFVLLLANLGCGGGYGEAIRLNSQFVSATESYIEGLEKADTAPEVAKAINSYADRMEVLMPKMRAYADEHPELKDPENQPEELKAAQRESEEVAKRMIGAFMKVGRHMTDSEVRAAQERLSKAMSG